MKTIQTKDYFDYFYSITHCKSHKEAYLQTEQLFFKNFGAHKYSNYETFRNAKKRYMQKLRDARASKR